jgi:hypothetical protein
MTHPERVTCYVMTLDEEIHSVASDTMELISPYHHFSTKQPKSRPYMLKCVMW